MSAAFDRRASASSNRPDRPRRGPARRLPQPWRPDRALVSLRRDSCPAQELRGPEQMRAEPRCVQPWPKLTRLSRTL